MSSGPFTNQPGGPFAEVPHDAVHGREVELRVLVDEVRVLAELTATAVLDSGQTAAVAARVEAVAARLEELRPEVPVPRFVPQVREGAAVEGMSPFDVITGLYNPVAVPLRMTYTDDEAFGVATFGMLYAGPPGLLHGAVIAACFDMVLAGANRVAGFHGPTANLTTTYHAPTRIDREVEFRARQESVDGRKIRSVAELRQDGIVTASAAGLFIHMDRSSIEKLGAD